MRRLVLACLTVAGCVGTVSDLDGGALAPDSGTVPDAGTPALDSGTGGSDAGTPDAGVPVDSGTPDVDAGTPDGGTADAGGCHAAFCDDFESYATGSGPTTPWSVSKNGGDVTVVTTKHHSGTQAVYVTTDGQSSYRQAYFNLSAPFFPKSEFYGRVWLYLTAVPTQTTHWTNIQGEGNVADAGSGVRASVRYGGQYSPQIMANYDTSGVGSDCWQHSDHVAMPAGYWSCYEWHYKEAGNLMELWVDSVPITSASVIDGVGQGCINHGLNDKWILPVFDTLRLGWEHYQTSDPMEMWMDDVALDTQRIGCQ